MALAIVTVANSIAALSVTGLVIKDVDEIPPRVEQVQPTLIPLPDYVTDFEIERMSYGGGSTALTDATYTLGYRLCYAPSGAGEAETIEYYDNMVAMVAAFLDAVITIETFSGGVEIEPISITNMGVVNDPAEHAFIGCDIHLRVKEFYT